MSYKLVKLNKKYFNQLSSMIDEWKIDQEKNNTNHSPWVIFKNDYHDFSKYLKELEIKKGNKDFVPNSVYFLLDTERNIFLGAVDIRHYLNDELLKHGGHIGDGIRPSERKKGYGNLIIKLALKKCRKLGINKVLIVCDKENIASKKAIISNGGVLENEIVNKEVNKIEERYWIVL